MYNKQFHEPLTLNSILRTIDFLFTIRDRISREVASFTKQKCPGILLVFRVCTHRFLYRWNVDLVGWVSEQTPPKSQTTPPPQPAIPSSQYVLFIGKGKSRYGCISWNPDSDHTVFNHNDLQTAVYKSDYSNRVGIRKQANAWPQIGHYLVHSTCFFLCIGFSSFPVLISRLH